MESIYERIQAAVQPDGTLPEGFFIQPEPENPKALRFADGAQDGIVFYHSGGRGDGALLEKLKEITRLAEELSIPTEQLTTVYFKCVNEVNSIWSQLMEVATDAPPPVNPETLLE